MIEDNSTWSISFEGALLGTVTSSSPTDGYHLAFTYPNRKTHTLIYSQVIKILLDAYSKSGKRNIYVTVIPPKVQASKCTRRVAKNSYEFEGVLQSQLSILGTGDLDLSSFFLENWEP